jgi:hypothetical protein
LRLGKVEHHEVAVVSAHVRLNAWASLVLENIVNGRGRSLNPHVRREQLPHPVEHSQGLVDPVGGMLPESIGIGVGPWMLGQVLHGVVKSGEAAQLQVESGQLSRQLIEQGGTSGLVVGLVSVKLCILRIAAADNSPISVASATFGGEGRELIIEQTLAIEHRSGVV